MKDTDEGVAPGSGALRDCVWQFGACRLDGRTLELTVDGALVRLEPKPLELLIHLLHHAGEVVTKDELHEAVWPGRILSESVLTKAVAKLRQALGDEEQTLVRTVHGYGYRLVAPVRVEAATAAPPRLGFAAGDAPPHRANWRLVAPLGAGGSGEAWLAEHAKTHERRVFKFALDADGLVALKREITLYRVLRDTYGERDGWVRVLDWNLDEAPCFIETEHLAGGDLRQWAEARGGLAAVPLDERLDWVAQAAEALSLAHAAGLLHRDLKPANVLVQPGEPGAPVRIALADFGSGRLLDPQRVQITRLGFTRTQAGDGDSGTPLYTAPECLAGQQPIATSDLYSLGILLYQVVVGDFTRPLTPGWEDGIEDELLREDVRAAAAGDPARRLRDAAELAARLRSLPERRLQRAREHEAAREAAKLRAALERSRVRRRWAWTTAAVFALATAVTGVMLAQLREANRQAQAERELAHAVNEFLVEDLIAAADPLTSGRAEVSVREVLDRGARAAGERYAGQPRAEAAVRAALGRAYQGVGEYPAALAQFDAARRLAAEGEGPADTLADTAALGAAITLTYLDDWSEVQARVEPLQASRDPAISLHARLLAARALGQSGDPEAARDAMAAIAPEFRRVFADEPRQRIEFEGVLARTLRDAGDLDAALEQGERAVAAAIEGLGEEHFLAFDARQTQAGTLMLAGRVDEALAVMQPAVQRAETLLGPDHYRTLVMKSDLGLALQSAGDLVGAERALVQALDGLQRQFGEDHRDVRTVLNNLGILYEDLGRQDDELRFLRRAYEAELRVVGARHPAALTATNNYARALGRAGRWGEAEALQSGNVAVAVEVLPADHWQLAVLRYNWGNQLGHVGRRDEALAQFKLSIDALTAQLGAEHPVTQRAIGLRDALPAP